MVAKLLVTIRCEHLLKSFWNQSSFFQSVSDVGSNTACYMDCCCCDACVRSSSLGIVETVLHLARMQS